MKRLFTLGIPLALVVTACGGGIRHAPSLAAVSAHADPSLHAVAAARRREAGREAAKLLHRVVLPRGARRIRRPAVLRRPDHGVSMLNELAYRRAFWRVRMPVQAAFAFVKAHPPRGFHYSGGGGLYRSLDFDNGLAGSGQRLLTVAMVRVGGGTDLRVDAGVAWIYPRSPREVVPSGAQTIDIRDGRLSRSVEDAMKLARIVRWFDALNVVQPGAVVYCPLILASRVTFVFRSASGARLARAVVPSTPATGCNPIAFSIRGHGQRPLIDGALGRRAFVSRVQRLLGLRFSER